MFMIRYTSLELWDLGDILNDRWTFVKLYPQKNDFWVPDGEQTRNLRMTGDTGRTYVELAPQLTIETISWKCGLMALPIYEPNQYP